MELAAGADAELGEDIAQVPLDRAPQWLRLDHRFVRPSRASQRSCASCPALLASIGALAQRVNRRGGAVGEIDHEHGEVGV